MSGRVKIKSKDKDKKPKIDVFKVIENRFKNMNELRDLIDIDPWKGMVRIRDGAGFREAVGGRGMLGRMEASPFPWIQRHDSRICMYKMHNNMILITQWGYFPPSIKTIDYVKKKNVKSNAITAVR